MPSMSPLDGVVFDRVLAAVQHHTHSLLGLTIGFSEEQWAQATRLRGWTRSHVAAHLADGARGLSRVCAGLAGNGMERMYESDRDKASSIERGALLPGLALQIALDETAGHLNRHLPSLAGKNAPVTLRAGYRIMAHHIPLARLYELVIHTFDLRVDSEELELEDDVAVPVLAFLADQIGGRPDWPSIRLVADEGYEGRVGADGDAHDVSGPARALIVWLARHVEAPGIRDAVTLPQDGLFVH